MYERLTARFDGIGMRPYSFIECIEYDVNRKCIVEVRVENSILSTVDE